MAKSKAVYAPGELAKTRGNIKPFDENEAKRMAQILGGEVGYERSPEQEAARNKPKRTRRETVELNVGARRSFRRVEAPGSDEGDSPGEARTKQKKRHISDSGDDPSVPVKANYWERVKMDRYCSQLEFEIKSSSQVLMSMLSLLSDPPDMVNPAFVNRRMNTYYQRIELLVTSVRTLFPRNNLKRNEKLKRASPFAFAVLDTFRYWNIEGISQSLSKLQMHPRNAKVVDFADILKYVYRPLFILENLDTDIHIKGSFKLLYKVLYLENPTEAKEKFQNFVRDAIISWGIIRRDIRFQMYPLLMKLLSDCYIPYENFFSERKNRIRSFLQVTEKNRLSPNAEPEAAAQAEAEKPAEAAAGGDAGDKPPEEEKKADPQTEEVFDESKMDEPLTEEERAKKAHAESEGRALERGLSTLEALFPKAGWDRLTTFPDMYPYFNDVFRLKKGVELIAPTDPLQQIVVLLRCIEELLFGLRYVQFGEIIGNDGVSERIDDVVGKITNDWQENTEEALDKTYLPRLDEYCRLLENTAESRTSSYAKRLLNELQWTKRLYFLPYYKFESLMPPPFQRNAIVALYPQIRTLRRCLTSLAACIDQAQKRGGPETHAPCEGIDNPWDPYIFQVPNPLSKRLDALLAPKRRNNASLIFFTLAITVVLDHLINDEDSWAYAEKSGFLYRSENGEGVRPLFGNDEKVDSENLFKQAMKKRLQAAQARAASAS